jgi:hypothetical protein
MVEVIFSRFSLATHGPLLSGLVLAGVWSMGLPDSAQASPLPGQPFPTVPLEVPKPTKDDPSFLAFASWTQKYRQAAKEKRTALEAEGIALAQKRRAALLQLIQNDPQHALEWAIAPKVRAALPAAVQRWLETRLSGCGDFNVLASFGGPTKRTLISRYAVFGDKPYKAFVYGRMRGLTTKYNIPLHGIALDNLLALHESPVRVLEAGETVQESAKIGNPDKKCPLCGIEIKDPMVAAQIGATYYFFDSPEHLQRVAAKLVEKQTPIGPKAGSFCDEPLDALIEEIKEDDAKTNPGIGFGNNGAPAGDFVPRVAPEAGDLPGALQP